MNIADITRTFINGQASVAEISRATGLSYATTWRIANGVGSPRAANIDKILSYAYSTGWTYNKENHEDNQAGGLKDNEKESGVCAA